MQPTSASIDAADTRERTMRIKGTWIVIVVDDHLLAGADA